jgi:thymidylate synthase
MQQYLDLLKHTLENGRKKTDRTGTGTISIFGAQSRYSLKDNNLPVVTTKKVHLKSVVHELLWMLRGDTNVNALKDVGVNIWNEWAAGNGELGPVYGKMWRDFPAHEKFGMGVRYRTVDQIKDLENQLRNNPDSRRLVVSGWHPGLLPDTSITPAQNAATGKQALPPCHTLFQFICEPMTLQERLDHFEKRDLESFKFHSEHSHDTHEGLDDYNVPKFLLSCQLYQRSGDLFLGVPFNIASYALLTHMLAEAHNMVAHEFIHTLGDAHIYSNHIKQVETQLKRKPRKEPTVTFNPEKRFDSVLDFGFDDIVVEGYKPHPAIKAEVAV